MYLRGKRQNLDKASLLCAGRCDEKPANQELSGRSKLRCAMRSERFKTRPSSLGAAIEGKACNAICAGLRGCEAMLSLQRDAALP